MPRKNPVTPSYKLHKPSGQAVVTLSGKDHYLGRYGTAASKTEYDQFIARWLANGRGLPPEPAEIILGPRAQALIEPFLDRTAEAFMFSPLEAAEERRQARRQARKCKIYPWEMKRQRKASPKKKPGVCYTVSHYRKAILSVCKRKKLEVWHPHQLRHTVGTELRKKYGIETARLLLGHKHLSATEIYAEPNREAAIVVMSEIG